MMIASTSIFRYLPVELDRKQLLFFDGMRHAAEIVSLAYSRLQQTLTRIALAENLSGVYLEYVSAFLDAWAIVDAIDRFRVLLSLVPGAECQSETPLSNSFEKAAQPIRDLRNVADHLAQRADYVVAHKGTALGVISWFTALQPDCRDGLICAIAPGTVLTSRHQVVNPIGRCVEYPTGIVELEAGEHRACLSDVICDMEHVVRGMETSIEQAISQVGLTGKHGAADILLKMRIQAKDLSSAEDVVVG